MSFSPDGSLLASGSADKLVKIWNLAENIEKYTLLGHDCAIKSVRFSLDGKLLASESEDRLIKIWDLDKKSGKCNVKSNPGLSELIEFSSDNKSILVKLKSGDAIRYSIPSRGVIDINNNSSISWAMNSKSLDLLSYGPGIQNPKSWLFTYYNLYFKKYENISKINTTFTNLKFSVVHFMTMLGEKNIIGKFIKNGELLLLVDAYGHSPIYYAIKFKLQEIADMHINYILEALEKEPSSFKLFALLESIQNDLATIILNSSQNLDLFLSSIF